MNQLDRIESKLTRLLEIAEALLAESHKTGSISPAAAELGTAIQGLYTDGDSGIAPALQMDAQPLDGEQDLQSLFLRYPGFREDFYSLDPELAALKGPMGAAMLKDATLGMIAKSLRVDVDVFVQKADTMLAGYAQEV